MENTISNYRLKLKASILKELNDARFIVVGDGHPSQYKLIEDILLNDFHVKFESIMTFGVTGRIYYILENFPKPEPHPPFTFGNKQYGTFQNEEHTKSHPGVDYYKKRFATFQNEEVEVEDVEDGVKL